ncbi:2-amino-4-hydroxy-6-hydroxymethyldihydropteridine diphosphokinase [Synechococcus sp. UW140]|uniref:2-amino-4-hydroxy-6- hydroxymethyldihydropteridine diphosphokinase n=1 Tax=Synechococcus sp. UW140 TaxID=368503 RepID=UPI0031381836
MGPKIHSSIAAWPLLYQECWQLDLALLMAGANATQPLAEAAAIALGSNLGDCLALLGAARQGLGALAQPGSLRCSPLFRTAPVGGPAGQPAFLNAVVLLQWLGSPEQLLAELQKLEAAAGRQRLVAWGPRSLDLDLLWCGTAKRFSPQLQLPHPRLWVRRFVLEPLASLDPNLRPPGQKLTAAELLADLLLDCSEPAPQQLPATAVWPD